MRKILRKQMTYAQGYPQNVDNFMIYEETVCNKTVNTVNTLDKQYIKRIESYQQGFWS